MEYDFSMCGTNRHIIKFERQLLLLCMMCMHGICEHWPVLLSWYYIIQATSKNWSGSRDYNYILKA